MKKIVFGVILGLFSTSLALAMQSSEYSLQSYVFNNSGNTQSAYHSTENRINYSSVGETTAGQSYSNQYSMQTGFFNDYYFDKPTATASPTMTVTATPIRDFGKELLDEQFVYPAPHPIRGPYANIYYHLSEPADVKIKIYTTTNRLVISKDFGSCPAGKNYWRWHVANLANGAYLMLIEAKNGNKRTKLIKKIAIIK